jgi:hypothetical protein
MRVKLLSVIVIFGLCSSGVPALAIDKADKADKSERPPDKVQDINGILNDTKLSYPELEVTPRASDRVEMEAKNEAKTKWLTHLPIQFSALMTLIAASNAKPKDNLSTTVQDQFDNTKRIAVGVGAGWLILTTALSAGYRPYFNGYKEISKMPASNPREELTRERIAEESLYAPEDLAIKLKWFSVFSNATVNIAMMAQADSTSEMMLTIAAISSIAPLLFDYRWTQIADQHRTYKKKIYGPLSSAVLLPVTDHQYSPGVGLLWTF